MQQTNLKGLLFILFENRLEKYSTAQGNPVGFLSVLVEEPTRTRSDLS